MFTIALVSFIVIDLSVHMSSTLFTGMFHQYEIQPWGCQTFPTFRNRLHCAVACQSNPQCYMNAFETKCQLCSGGDVSHLNFTAGQFYFFKEHACWHSVAGGSNLSLPVPLSYGMVVRWVVNVQKGGKLILDSLSADGLCLNFHCLPRMEDNEIFLNLKIFPRIRGNAFNQMLISITQRFPIVNGLTTQVNLLVTLDKFKVFFSGAHAADIPHTKPFSDVKVFQWFGVHALDFISY